MDMGYVHNVRKSSTVCNTLTTLAQLVSMVLCANISTPSPSVFRRTISTTLNTIGILLGVTLWPLLSFFGCRPCH
jgi:hypothetical protein